MVYYEVINSEQEKCNGCILSIIDENKYEITIEEDSQYKKQPYPKLEIINRETQQIVFRDSYIISGPTYHFQVLKAGCCKKKSGQFCILDEFDTIKILSQKEALLKIL